MDATPEGTYPAPPRSWWSRNWKWAVPTGCLALILGCCGVGTLATVLGVFEGMVKPGLSVYGPAAHTATTDAEVQALLGAPVVARPPSHTQLNTVNGQSRAQLTVPLQGARAEGTLHVEAHKQDDDTWAYDRLEVEAEGAAAPIDLRDRVKAPPPPAAPPAAP